MKAVCPGSFDPVTYGHLDVIERTAGLADEVVVAVGNNPSKAGLFSPAERVEMLQAACASWPQVTVTLFSGLLVDFCRGQDIQLISKGLRTGDVDVELQMAQMNRALSGIDTLWWPTAPEWSFVSSSLVREIAALGGDVSGFLPPMVAARTKERAQQPSRRPR